MAQTQPYKRTLGGSIGAGLNSVFGNGGRTYYILEHKVSSQYHKAGESQEIIVDQIELGRDAKCQVRFDDSFNTVSRRHAAIVRDGQNWKLVQLSTTNSTFLNGRPIQKEWYLQNGDEIQLSVNGPKLGFIIPSGNKSTVGSIGLSRRLSLFRQQALRPYKTALWSMASVLALLICVSTAIGIRFYKQIDPITATIEELVEKLEKTKMDLNEAREIAEKSEKERKEESKRREKELANTQAVISNLNEQIKHLQNEMPTSPVTLANITEECEKDVYYVEMICVIDYYGETKYLPLGSGTGFLLDDGRFITARHVVEPWKYIDRAEGIMFDINRIIHNNIKDITFLQHILHAVSPTGKEFYLSFDKFKKSTKTDQEMVYTDENNDKWSIVVATIDGSDWAYTTVDMHGNELGKGELVARADLSTNLLPGTELTILGYPYGIGASKDKEVSPLYSKATVAQKELSEEKTIVTTATSFEHGNSGGPVFATVDKQLVVIGIVSAGVGRSTGFVVPMANLK